jgi:hypothetical protein
VRLAPDLDAIEALASERESLWKRVGEATFLTDDEKREAVGYGVGAGSDLERKWPGQPRIPRGQPGSGRFTFGRDPNRTRRPRSSCYRGHHFVPRQIFDKEPFRPETRRVFEQATTGRLSEPHRRSGEHIRYNIAVKEHFDRFKEVHKLTSEEMTPDHARAFLREIFESRDPRIRYFNRQIMMREVLRMYRRWGRRID